jgi:ribonuclease BN (tRNA processing enzyme)
MKIRILGAHNRESAESRMVSFLVDDILAVDAGSLATSLSLNDQQRLKAILLTHSHYDHSKDIPSIALNLFSLGKAITVYTTRNSRDAVIRNFLNGEIYPDFTRLPENAPTVRFSNVELYKQNNIEGLSVVAVPVNHGCVAVGYEIMSPQGKKMFYAADTGPGLTSCWDHVSPDLLIIEVTFPDRFKEMALNSKHLTPMMLERELVYFKLAKGYLPKIVVVHVDPELEMEIKSELEVVSWKIGNPISVAYEGMELQLNAEEACQTIRC